MLNYRVLDDDNNLVAKVKDPGTAAAIIASVGGDGWQIRATAPHGAVVLWEEGGEVFPASESYDAVAALVHERDPR